MHVFDKIYQQKRILVTGHTGFKGSWLIAWLAELGAQIFGIALEPDTKPSHFELLKSDIESHIFDIGDYAKIESTLQKIKPEIIFHLAAQPLVRDSYDLPLETFATNVLGVANLLSACRKLESLRAIVIVTSDKCYENKEWVWGYRENDPMGGYDPYSASKGCAELVTACFRNSYFNLDNYGKTHQTLIASARAGNVIGGGDWAKDRLVPDIMRAVTENRKVSIRSPKSTRPWQHVLECLSGYLVLGAKLLQGEKSFAEAWNFASVHKTNTSVLAMVKEMQAIWPKLQYEVSPETNKLHEANLLQLDSSKAQQILKWHNVWDLSETVAITTEWYRNFYENKQILTLDHITKYCKDAKQQQLEWS